MLAILSALAVLIGAPVDPLRFLQMSVRDHQVVFLGDIHPLAEPISQREFAWAGTEEGEEAGKR